MNSHGHTLHRAEISTKLVCLETVDRAVVEIARPVCRCGWTGPYVLFAEDIIVAWHKHLVTVGGLDAMPDPAPLFVKPKHHRRKESDWDGVLKTLREGGA